MNTSSKVILVFMISQLIILLLSPLGYQFGVLELMTALGGVTMSFVGSLLALLAIVVLVLIAWVKKRSLDKGALVIASVMALVPVIVMLPQLQKGGSVPPIHDITTNPMDPPTFLEIVERRARAMNDLEYGDAERTPEDMAALQAEFYPEVDTLITPMTVAAAASVAEQVLTEMDLELVDVNPAQGRLEATATTFWFGFKDDLVVRVRAEGDQAIIDLRSVSRVGQSDLGVNAERIETFLNLFTEKANAL